MDTIAQVLFNLVFVLIIVLAPGLAKPDVDSYTVVKTHQGNVQGKIIPVVRDDGQKEMVYRFRNIPYAQPPIGNLRWKPPKQATKWEDTLMYSDHQIWCAQPRGLVPDLPDQELSEDCLILTIRQPASATPAKPLPVLVWIHGGALIYGSSDWYYPDEQTTSSLGMVTVSINYRLSIFGFLSIKEMWTIEGEYHNYGNFGILDMILALEWIQKNILFFGGDSNHVTILGHSGGAAGVFSLVTSPYTTGLFHKAIAASGYPVSLESDYNRADARYGETFKKDLNCNHGKEKDIAKCLRERSTEDVMENIPGIKRPLKKSLDFSLFPYNERLNDYPIRVLDGNVLPAPLGHDEDYLKTKLKILIGDAAHELPPQNETETMEGLQCFLEPRILSFTSSDVYKKLMNLYKEKRPKDKSSPKQITPQLIYLAMAGDVALSCQNNYIVQNISRRKSNLSVYRYITSQALSTNPLAGDFPTYAYHGIDMDALFGIKYRYPKYNITEHDKHLISNIRRMVKMFVYDDGDGGYFHKNFYNRTIEFWEDEIITWDKQYHEKECDLLRKHGFLKRSWGQLG